MKYEKFYIPDSLEQRKFFGFENDEILLLVTGIWLGMFLGGLKSLIIQLFTIFVVVKYRKLKRGKYHCFYNLKYSECYNIMGLKHLPKPFVREVR